MLICGVSRDATDIASFNTKGWADMKKIGISLAALAVTAGSALAADLPSFKAPPPPPPPMLMPPMWTGFYAGLNAGYAFGTNDNYQSSQFGPYGGAFNGTGPIGGPVAGLLNGFLGGINNVGAPGLAQSGSAGLTQSGFIGGGQIGYNYQWGSNFVIGFETDIQGTGVRGSSQTTGAASAITPLLGGLVGLSTTAMGGSSVQAGVDWLGTVRGRVGYLVTPAMLLYATGGLTYGGVYANVSSSAMNTNALSLVIPGGPALGASITQPFIGGGNVSQINVGWNVGGGVEWMFMPNWSLKGEAIYYNLGNATVHTGSFAPNVLGVSFPGNTLAWGLAATTGASQVNYQGVIARAGVNYHFNFGGSYPVVAKY